MNTLSLFSAVQDAAASVGADVRSTAQLARDKLEARAVEFEGLYLAQMLQPMFEGLEAAKPFGGGFGEDVWQSLQVQEYGKAIAKQGGIGLADAVARQLIEAQEARDGRPS